MSARPGWPRPRWRPRGPWACAALASAAALALCGARRPAGAALAGAPAPPRAAGGRCRRARRGGGACVRAAAAGAPGGAEGDGGEGEEGEEGAGAAGAVRVVAMSDTHGYHRNLRVPEGDVLVHCGDAACGGRWARKGRRRDRGRERFGEEPFSEFAAWFRGQPHRRKFFVDGNHDNYRQMRDMLGEHLLVGSLECLGLRLHGLPYSRSDRGCAELPAGLDVLVSHVPPHGVLDEADRREHRAKRPPGLAPRRVSVGSTPLRERLADLGEEAPRLHLFGHIHESRGVLRSTRGTLFANVANANPGVATCLHHGCMVFDVAVNGSREVEIVKRCSEGLRRPPRRTA